MTALRAASLRHLLRHPAQLALALVGLALGVGTIVAVEVATASARRAFELSAAAVNGAATHQITGGPQGIDEQLYVRLRTAARGAVRPRARFAPVAAGYVTAGGRVMELIGLDPFASAGLEDGASRPAAFGTRGIEEARGWFTQPGAVVMSAAAARALGVAEGGSFELRVGGVAHTATLIARLPGTSAALDTLLLTDIAQAQEWLQAIGRLSRIDVRLPAGPEGAALARELAALLPPDLMLRSTRAGERETLAMTDAFMTNLKAMSLLALLVGTLLIYGAVSFAVLQRRAIIGVLRALGATRREVLTLVLGEAAVLGLAGAVCGVVLGLVIGRGLVGLVSRTINDLYFVLAVSEVSVPPGVVLEALGAGLATALVAALLPALEAAGNAPALGLARSVLEGRAARAARRLAVLGLALACGAGLTVALSHRSLLAGFVALFLLLLAVAAVTPAVLRALALGAARLAARLSSVARLACADVGASLSRTGVAIAALGMALTAMIGVGVMVESFRESLREWLVETMRADVYVSAPGVTEGLEGRLEPPVIQAILAVPGIRAHSEGRRVTVASPAGPVDLNAVSLAAPGYAGFRFTAGDAAHAWQQFAQGAILVSEPLAWRLSLVPGSTLTLVTAAGARAFAVAGVYREYGNDRGEVLIDLAAYRRWWRDEAIAGLGLYLAPGVGAAQVIDALRAAVGTRQALLARSNAA
ncbi:MAG TPA: FtsX-like permease family protein, partial [Steroidobacteraceae bacterium]|nr:FtsX-like permease family protein [Steroidobacteraceae bacterium]